MVTEVLAVIFGASTALFGILFRNELERRRNLERQVFQNKRDAYAAFNEFTNELLRKPAQPGASDPDPSQLIEIRKRIWEYGSPEVVRSFEAFHLFHMRRTYGTGGLVLMARLILAMRKDMGLSNKDLTPLTILRIILTDTETNYEESLRDADEFTAEIRRSQIR